MLIKLGADVNFQNNYGENALRGAVLMVANRNGHSDIAEILERDYYR